MSTDRIAGTRKSNPLIVRSGRLLPPAGPPVEISDKPILLGRDPGCDIVLSDPEVSATHCEIRGERDGVLVRDLGSSNGTFIGPVRVVDGVYLTKPCTLTLGSSAVQFEPTGREPIEVASEERFGALVGVAPSTRRLFRQLREVAVPDLRVLLTGEMGTGKELAAKAIHEHSARAGKRFEVVDCTTIVDALAESQLFGHEPGAFTGAVSRADGAFHRADGGTVFLDEIGELKIDLQPKLLRVLAEGKVQRLGGRDYQKVNVRVIAATHRDLGRLINAGRFRADLFFRLRQVPIELSPLRDRREDIPSIVRAVCARMDRPERGAALIELLRTAYLHYAWPGNVRELVQWVEAAALLPEDGFLWRSVLPGAMSRENAGPATPFGKAKAAAIDSFERRYWIELSEAAEGNVSEMARQSGMERHHVRRYLRKYGLLGTTGEV